MTQIVRLSVAVLAFFPTVARPAEKPAAARHVLMISLDGFKPEYVTKASEHGLKLPNFSTFLSSGTFADGVIGITPTITLPSHTTLLTGVWPVEHGILDNNKFDPYNDHSQGWEWTFKDIKAETLVQAAQRAGLTTAVIAWPVSIDGPADYLISSFGAAAGGEDRRRQTLRPENILTMLPKLPAGDHGEEQSAVRAEQIIRKFNPNLVCLYLGSLDHQEHMHGPFSPEADAVVESQDKIIGDLVATEREVNPDADIVIVSDHGFASVDHRVSLNPLFVKEGLITLSDEKSPTGGPKVASWKAEAWFAGGSTAIMLRDPANIEVKQKVEAILTKIADDPAYGVARILTHDEVVKQGGFPNASFLVGFKPGWASGSAFTGDVITSTPGIGAHGYLPETPEMRSTFMTMGADVAKGRDLGLIDMRQIAPTVAQMLRITLPAAKSPAVHYEK